MANITDDNGAIQTGLRADIMRKSMENKNLLSSKGSIYVGTGNTNNIVVNESTVSVPITSSLTAGNQNEVLSVGASNTLQYSKITPAMMASNTDVYDITCSTAISANQAVSATTAGYSNWAVFSGNEDSSGPDTSATIYNKFQTASSSVTSIEQKITQIENMMNKGVDLLTSTSAYAFTVVVDGVTYRIGSILFSKQNSVRYYNSCFLYATILLDQMDEDNENFDGFEAFYKNGEVATCTLNLNVDNKNYLPQQDVEFYVNTDVKIRYDLKAVTDPTWGSSIHAWFSIVIGQPLLLKIKTTGEITLEAKGLPNATKTSGSQYMVLDSFELGEYNSNISIPQPIITPQNLPIIKIYYLPKIND